MASLFKVKLHIYDLSCGTFELLSPFLLGEKILGIWHTGVVVYGKEYYFSSDGIKCSCPDMGSTEVPEDVFQHFLKGLSENKFKPDCYNLFEHNCNTFSNEVTQFLTGTTIPKNIQELPKRLLNT